MAVDFVDVVSVVSVLVVVVIVVGVVRIEVIFRCFCASLLEATSVRPSVRPSHYGMIASVTTHGGENKSLSFVHSVIFTAPSVRSKIL